MIKKISDDNKLMGYLEDNDFNRNLTIFLSRNIYRWLIDPAFTSELKKGQKDLTALQINEIADDLRDLITIGSLGKNFTEGLDKVSKKRFHKDFRRLQSRLKSDGAYNSTFLTYLQMLIKTVFRLVSGKYKISRLSGTNQTIANYLLKDEACIEDNEFNRMVLLFLSRYVYRFIIHPTFKLDFKRKLLNPTTPQLNRIAKWLRRKVIRRSFPYEWLKKLDDVRKKEFEENYEKLRTRLKLDQIFSYEYLTNLRNLTQFVFNLVVGKFKFSELEGLYREVANYLGGLKTFLYDEELSYDFKWSFIIVICRIVYDTIVDQGYFKKPKVERERIRIDLTENESIGIKLNVSEREVKYKYFEEVDLVSRKEFADYYEKLQFRLNLDQIYGLTFIAEVRYLTTVVFELIEGKLGRIPSTNFIHFIGEDLLRNWDANLNHKWIPKATLSREPISQLMLNEKIEEYNKNLIEQDTMKDNKNYEFNGEKELNTNSRKDEEFTEDNLSSFSESRDMTDKSDEFEKSVSVFQSSYSGKKPRYPDSEVENVWMPKFEKYGDYKEVAKDLNKLYGRVKSKLAAETISRRIKKLFDNEMDYINWYNQFAKQKNYPDEHIKEFWKPAFEQMGNYRGVGDSVAKYYGGKAPTISSIEYGLRKLFEDYPNLFIEKTFLEWFSKYTILYTDEIVEYWIKLFQKFKSYRSLRDYLISKGGRIPTISTIRNKVQAYFRKKNMDYISWIKKHESTSHYYEDDVLLWKFLFEEVGTYRGVALRFEQIDGRLPDHKNIKRRLQNFFNLHPQYFNVSTYKEWEGNYGRNFHSDPIIERWIKLFERYGSFFSVLKIEKSNRLIKYRLPSNADTLEKQVNNYLKNDFRKWFEKHHNPTPIPIKREKIIRELHKNPPQSFQFIAKIVKTNRHTISNIAQEEFDPITYEERWYNKIPQNTSNLIIYDILNTQLSLRRIAEKWDISRTPIIRLALEVCDDYEERFPTDDYLYLGTLFHIRLNSILTDFFKSINIMYFSESAIFPPTWKRADGLLINDNHYINLIVSRFNLQNIKAIQLEFTFDLSEENLIEKVVKYQHPDILLFIVGSDWVYTNNIQYKPLPNNSNIIYPQNIRVMSPSYFVNTIQLKGRHLDKFRELLEYNNTNNLNELKSLVELDVLELNKTSELERYLKKSGYSIKTFFGYNRNVVYKSLDNFNLYLDD